jgi:hypothetical protein
VGEGKGTFVQCSLRSGSSFERRSRQASIVPRTLSRMWEPMIWALSSPLLRGAGGRLVPLVGGASGPEEAGVSAPELSLVGGGAT